MLLINLITELKCSVDLVDMALFLNQALFACSSWQKCQRHVAKNMHNIHGSTIVMDLFRVVL